jgi:hypothetical protein
VSCDAVAAAAAASHKWLAAMLSGSVIISATAIISSYIYIS